jgi:hypothetical protein
MAKKKNGALASQQRTKTMPLQREDKFYVNATQWNRISHSRVRSTSENKNWSCVRMQQNKTTQNLQFPFDFEIFISLSAYFLVFIAVNRNVHICFSFLVF